jgi:membrane associated rhomboid family serine protease
LSGGDGLIIPWKVDVPEERFPFINWLIIAGAVTAFVFQTISIYERGKQLPAMEKEYADSSVEEVAKDFGVDEKQLKELEKSADKASNKVKQFVPLKQDSAEFKEKLIKQAILEEYFVWAKIRPFLLHGFNIKGLFGHIWLHGGILHLLGNMLFLWIFGNAVCAKIGNIRYLPIYVLLGLVAGISQEIFAGGSGLGASGAINGIVGMYLVFFPLNEITCYFVFLFFFRPIIKGFSLSSYWMILFWLVFDIWGAMQGGGQVAYFAHLGGFAVGVVLAILMLKFKLVKMENYETSLLQAIEDYRRPVSPDEFKPHYQGYLELIQNEPQQPAKAATAPFEPKTIEFDPPIPVVAPLIPKVGPPKAKDAFIRFMCSCGKRLKMPSQYAGKMGKCPQCNARVIIPNS